jgi:hypothetical protein
MNARLFARPGAFVPLLMSLAALAVVLAHIAFTGPVRAPDEGAAAHLFQLLIAGQVPVVVFFAVKWMQRNTRQALVVLGWQALAIAIALAPVWYFSL